MGTSTPLNGAPGSEARLKYDSSDLKCPGPCKDPPREFSEHAARDGQHIWAYSNVIAGMNLWEEAKLSKQRVITLGADIRERATDRGLGLDPIATIVFLYSDSSRSSNALTSVCYIVVLQSYSKYF